MPELESATQCPHCNYPHEAVTSLSGEDAMPREGDISFCANCGMFSAFSNATEGGLRPLTMEEWVEIHNEVDVAKILAAWRFARMLVGKEAILDMSHLLVEIEWNPPMVKAILGDLFVTMSARTGTVVEANTTPGTLPYKRMAQAAEAFRSLLSPEEIPDA